MADCRLCRGHDVTEDDERKQSDDLWRAVQNLCGSDLTCLTPSPSQGKTHAKKVALLLSSLQSRSKVLPLSLAELQVENEGRSMKAETLNILIHLEQGTCDHVVSPRPAHTQGRRRLEREGRFSARCISLLSSLPCWCTAGAGQSAYTSA